MEYKAIAEGLNKRILVPESEIIPKLNELFDKNPNKDYYVSVFNYKQHHYDEFKKTNTLSGIRDVTTNGIIFDFDSKDLQKAKDDTLTLIGRLTQKGVSPQNINVYYSGSKGMHVELISTSEFTRDEADAIRTALVDDLETRDKSIKDEQRILRAPLTKNQKSGLYKIPLTVEELSKLSCEEIKEAAKEITDYRMDLASEYFNRRIDIPESILALKKQAKIVSKEADVDDKPDFSKNKTGFTNAKYALLEGYFEEGERHEATMILASTYKALGWHQELVYNNLKATYRLRARRLGLPDMKESDKEELWKEITSVFSPLWLGGTFSEETNDLLIKTKKRYDIQDKFESNMIVSLPEVNNIFSSFAKNIDKNTLKLGIASFDHEIRVTTSTLVGLLAAPSAGKSSISFGILNSTSNDGIKSMFFSLDMAAPQVYQRLAQRHTGYDADRLFKAYQTNDSAVIERVENTLHDAYKNVKFCFRGGISVEDIRSALIKEKELTGEFPKLVVVDYLECITTNFSDPTISKGFAARMLKDMANEFAICVLLLVQPAKVSGSPEHELNSYTNIKGSSVISEACSQVFTLSRPGFNPKNPEDDNYLTITVVKNRMGQLGSFDYHWTGVTGSIRELMTEEANALARLREQKIKQQDDDL